jgi:hypothetical protein
MVTRVAVEDEHERQRGFAIPGRRDVDAIRQDLVRFRQIVVALAIAAGAPERVLAAFECGEQLGGFFQTDREIVELLHACLRETELGITVVGIVDAFSQVDRAREIEGIKDAGFRAVVADDFGEARGELGVPRLESGDEDQWLGKRCDRRVAVGDLGVQAVVAVCHVARV